MFPQVRGYQVGRRSPGYVLPGQGLPGGEEVPGVCSPRSGVTRWGGGPRGMFSQVRGYQVGRRPPGYMFPQVRGYQVGRRPPGYVPSGQGLPGREGAPGVCSP